MRGDNGGGASSSQFADFTDFLRQVELARRVQAYVEPGRQVCIRHFLRGVALSVMLLGAWVTVFLSDAVTWQSGVAVYAAVVVLRRFSMALFVGELREVWRRREALGTSPLWEKLLADEPRLAEVERGMDRSAAATKAWRWWHPSPSVMARRMADKREGVR